MNSSDDKLKQAFAQAFGLDPHGDIESMKYGEVECWDSTAHMVLIAEIEMAFDLALSTDEVIDLSSFEKAREIVAKYAALI